MRSLQTASGYFAASSKLRRRRRDDGGRGEEGERAHGEAVKAERWRFSDEFKRLACCARLKAERLVREELVFLVRPCEVRPCCHGVQKEGGEEQVPTQVGEVERSSGVRYHGLYFSRTYLNTVGR